MTWPPRHFSLYVAFRLKSPHPWSRIALFKPDLAATFLPGSSAVPAAEAAMFTIFKSSITK